LSRNTHLVRWVEKMRELTQPNAVHWVDGSAEENEALCAGMLRTGTLTKLNDDLWPGCYYARSDASDVARVLPRDAIDESFSLDTQLRNVDAIFDRVFVREPAAIL
jgi:phosphoenolpyruvate carboxykinase (GTP)